MDFPQPAENARAAVPSWRHRGIARRFDLLAFLALAVVVLGFAIHEHPFWRPVVTVRSCGGNFDMLAAFAADFERQHRCRVQYVAAPVQFLLELAVQDPAHLPEVMVGRSGPGWRTLEERRRLAGAPEFFAVDPLVMVTAKGNPCGVRTLTDLGREGLRIASAPYAMRPKGKVVAELIATVSERSAPGLVDAWERNTVDEAACGRLLGRSIVRGTADAAVMARSQTVLPPLAGACDVIEIPVADLDCMRSGRGSLPQAAARTVRNSESQLADRFVEELLGGAGGVVAQYGYVPVTASEFVEYAPFMRISAPVPMAPRQMTLAGELARDGATDEAIRRYLYAIHVFGPGRHDAEAWFRIGATLCRHERWAGAVAAWERLRQRHPTSGRKEWTGAAPEGADISEDTEWSWVQRAGDEMKRLPAVSSSAPSWLAEVMPDPIQVREGDPPKGARRTLAVAIDLLDLGLYDFALRDALKVVSLHYPSPHMATARALAGAAQYRRGDVDGARHQWHQVCEDFPASSWAAPCAAACDTLPGGTATSAQVSRPCGMPHFVPVFETHADRGMTYAWELYRAGLPLYAGKEYLKTVLGLYGESGYTVEACFRCGVCFAEMGNEAGAVRQWRRCLAAAGNGGDWMARAADGLAHRAEQPPPDAQRRRSLAIPEALTSLSAGPGKGPKSGNRPPALMRLHLGEELLIANVLDDDQALQEFLKVLTVVELPERLQPLRTTAHLRAAQVLLLAGCPGPALVHLEQAAAAAAPMEHVEEAADILGRLRSQGRVAE